MNHWIRAKRLIDRAHDGCARHNRVAGIRETTGLQEEYGSVAPVDHTRYSKCGTAILKRGCSLMATPGCSLTSTQRELTPAR